MKLRPLLLLSSLPYLLMSNIVTADCTPPSCATQTLTLTVPLVALIDVDTTTTPTFTFESPSNAGDGFNGNILISNEEAAIAISSNMPNAKLKAHIDTDLSQYNIKLSAKAQVPGKSTSKKILSTTDTELSTVNMIVTTSAKVTLDADTTVTGSMIPYGTYNANIIYTLTQN